MTEAIKITTTGIRGGAPGQSTEIVFPVNNPLVLICGRNGAGKSTMTELVRRALCGEWPKDNSDMKAFLQPGRGQGSLIISGEVGLYELTLPGKPVSNGWPEASEFSSGLRKLAAQKKEVIATFLQQLMKSEPTKVDLAKELKRIKYTEGMSNEEAISNLEKIWDNKNRKGWDGAHKDYEKRRVDLQAQWRQITGVGTYPRVNAGNWTPPNWDTTLEGKKLEPLEEELKKAEQMLTEMHRFDAIQENELERLRESAEGLHEAAKARDEAIVIADKLESEYKTATEAFKRLPRPAAQVKTFDCWSCGAHIDEQTRKEPPKQQTEAELAEINKNLAEAQEALNDLSNRFHLAQNTALQARERFYESERNRDKLRELEKVQGEKPSERAVAEAQRKVELCRQKLEAFKLKSQADAKFNDIQRNNLLVSLFDPDGWRATFSTDTIKVINEQYLQPQCEMAGYPEIKIDRSQCVWYDGDAYAARSEGQQYRVDAMLQIALARIEGADMMVFDRLEALDNIGHYGFFQLLANCGIPALVFHLTKRELAYDLEEMGIGVTYWLEDGRIQPLKAVPV